MNIAVDSYLDMTEQDFIPKYKKKAIKYKKFGIEKTSVWWNTKPYTWIDWFANKGARDISYRYYRLAKIYHPKDIQKVNR